MPESTEYLSLANQAAWRAWLENHHSGATHVWLVHTKKGIRAGTLTYEEAVEEALYAHPANPGHIGCGNRVGTAPPALRDGRAVRIREFFDAEAALSLGLPSGEWLFWRHLKRPAALRREPARLMTTVDERHTQLLASLKCYIPLRLNSASQKRCCATTSTTSPLLLPLGHIIVSCTRENLDDNWE